MTNVAVLRMRVGFHTLGCKTNAYETQAIREQMEQAGWEEGSFSEPCDVYVINTCAVTKEASRKSRQMIGRCRRLNQNALVVVTGCYAQEEGERLLSDTDADILVGNSEKNQILPLIQRCLKEREEGRTESKKTVMKDLTHCREFEDQSISSQKGHTRVYVKIQDGCDRFCSYCLIPYLRGRSRSRKPQDILREVRALAEEGCAEVVLTGIDISSFAYDLTELICKIADIPGILRIRLGSLEEGIISRPFLERLCQVPSFCPQFHLSLQSGSDSVLARMNRHYQTRQYEDAVALIRKYYPEAGITTDLIAGFPSETEEEFQETLDFVQRIGFSRIHAFPFSVREGTRAEKMPGQLSKTVKEERTRMLIAAGAGLQEAYESRLIGTRCEILAEECISLTDDQGQARTFLAGYTPEYVRILASAGTDHAKAEKEVGRLVYVRPTGFGKERILLASRADLG